VAQSWISFGPDLEPLAHQARQQAGTPGGRADGLLVTGSGEEVAARLAEAASSAGGFCALEQVLGEERRPVFVRAAAVRFVADAP
jgi:hypothetical protein